METAFTWVQHLGRVCLWGSLWIIGTSLLCRWLPRLSASMRAGLWWLICAKVLLDLCLMAPLALPVLPAPRAGVLPAQRSLETGYRGHLLVQQRGIRPGKAVMALLAPVTPSRPLPSRAPLLADGLLALWLVGVGVSLAFELKRGLALHRLCASLSAFPLSREEIFPLAKRFGLRHTPRILTGPGITTPCVTGWFHPTILLPPGLAETLSETEMRLTLAHEMAHLKRGDLWMAAVPMLAHALLFFHPGVWWAASEWAAAREEACDALALSTTQLSSADYGRLLLKFASTTASAPALGLSPGYHTLRRRLLGLTRAPHSSRSASLLFLLLPGLLPWRLTTAPMSIASSQAAASAVRYTITTVGSSTDSEVAALNNAGEIALTVQHGSDTQSYTGSADQWEALGALPKHHASIAYAINPQGQAVGASFNISGHGRAFFWDGAPHRIGSLPGYPYSEARGINNAGQVAGFSETGGHDRWHAWMTRAFLAQQGMLTDLGTLGGPYSAAYAVSDAGVVVGKADTDTFGATHAFAWADGSMADLGTLGGANSVAYAINTSGQIVGASELDTTQTRHAFLYTNGQMRDLGTLPGLTDSQANAVNTLGVIVGVSQNAGDSQSKHATLWQNGQPTDLNTLLPPHSPWTLTEGRAINDHGQIVGQGLFHGQLHAFLLSPR